MVLTVLVYKLFRLCYNYFFGEDFVLFIFNFLAFFLALFDEDFFGDKGGFYLICTYDYVYTTS